MVVCLRVLSIISTMLPVGAASDWISERLPLVLPEKVSFDMNKNV